VTLIVIFANALTTKAYEYGEAALEKSDIGDDEDVFCMTECEYEVEQ